MLAYDDWASTAFAISERACRLLRAGARQVVGHDYVPAALQQLERRVPRESRIRRRLPAVYAMFGDLAGAVQLLEERATRLTRERARLAPPAPARRASARPVTHVDASAALRLAVSRLREAGVTPFLCFGTLLGAVREGGFIGHDGDIDLGVFIDQADATRLRQVFRRSGELRLALSSLLTPLGSVVKLRHRSGVSIDLVLFERRAEAFITRVVFQDHVLERRRRPFQLIPMVFAGVEVWVPDPPEAFLDENYGDWRTPKPDYHFVLSSRMPLDPQDVLVRFFSYIALVAALEQGSWRSARWLANEALARGIHDTVLTRLADMQESDWSCVSIQK
jgi:hypothetical protein